GIIRAKRDEKAGRDGILPKQRQQPWNTFLQPDPGINIDFDGNLWHALLLLSPVQQHTRFRTGSTAPRVAGNHHFPLALDLSEEEITCPGSHQASTLLHADNRPRWPSGTGAIRD